MKDEILDKAYPEDPTAIPRYQIYAKDGSLLNDGVEIRLINNVKQPGTLFNTYNMLKNETAVKVGLNDAAVPDDVFQKLVQQRVVSLGYSKVDTRHALTGLNGLTGIVSATFKPTAAFADGDTFTVDGTPYVAKLTNGDSLSADAFAANVVVSVVIDTTSKVVNFKSGGGGSINIVSAKSQPPMKDGLWIKEENIEHVYTSYPGAFSPSITQFKATLPTAISAAGAAYYNGSIYVFAGYSSSAGNEPTSNVYKIDLKSEKVDLVSSGIPSTTANPCPIAHKTYIVFNDGNMRSYNRQNVWQFDPASTSFSSKTSDISGAIKRGSQVAKYGNSAYYGPGFYFNGVSLAQSRYVSKLDLDTFIYAREGTEMPSSYIRCNAATVVNNLIYFFCSPDPPNNTGDILAYDPNTQIYTVQHSSSYAFAGNIGCAYTDATGNIWVFGLSKTLNSSVMGTYDTATNTFKEMGVSIDENTNYSAGVFAEGKYYIIGGSPLVAGSQAPWAQQPTSSSVRIFDTGIKLEPNTAIVECGTGNKNTTILYKDKKVTMQQSISKVSVVDSTGVLRKADAAIIVDGVVKDIV